MLSVIRALVSRIYFLPWSAPMCGVYNMYSSGTDGCQIHYTHKGEMVPRLTPRGNQPIRQDCLQIDPQYHKAQPHVAMLYTSDRMFQKLLRYIKIACDMLRFIFQHVGIFTPDFGMAQPFIIRFSNGFQYCDDDLINFPMICEA